MEQQKQQLLDSSKSESSTMDKSIEEDSVGMCYCNLRSIIILMK